MPFDIRHHHVLERQIGAYGNFDPFIMDRFEKIPRSFFVPQDLAHKAYVEDILPLSGTRAVMMPLSLAKLMTHLPQALEKNSMVVGGNTGYAAAILSYLVSSLFLLESDERFLQTAQAGFSALHIDNVVVCPGPLKEGLMRQGPFHFILIEGAVEYVPSCFFDQLSEDSLGVFACQFKGLPVGMMTRFQRNQQGLITKKELFEMPAYPLKDFFHPPRFEF